MTTKAGLSVDSMIRQARAALMRDSLSYLDKAFLEVHAEVSNKVPPHYPLKRWFHGREAEIAQAVTETSIEIVMAEHGIAGHQRFVRWLKQRDNRLAPRDLTNKYSKNSPQPSPAMKST